MAAGATGLLERRTAAADPGVAPFPYHGELSWDGAPFDGAATLRFALDRLDGDTWVDTGWTETQIVAVYKARFVAWAGSVSSLPAELLDPGQRWALRIAASKNGVDFVNLLGRAEVGAVPNAATSARGASGFAVRGPIALPDGLEVSGGALRVSGSTVLGRVTTGGTVDAPSVKVTGNVRTDGDLLDDGGAGDSSFA